MNNVEQYTTALSKPNAYWMARIAGQIYTRESDNNPAPDEVKILKNLKEEDENFIEIFGVSKNSAQAALIEHENYLCFAFRGTDEITDWLDNLNMFPERAIFGEFHRGFWNSVSDVWQELFEKYKTLKDRKKRPLFLTGHSLGGAMATIAAARLIHMDLPFISTYTFGQPRAMTLETSRIFNVEAKYRFFRFQNNNDIVTRLPSRIMSYSHVGSFLYISEEKKLYNDPGLWFRFLDSVDGTFTSFREMVEKNGGGRLDAIEDHDMKLYLDAIKQWNCDF
ncbi:lipase family protein [Pseudanabaena sp. PCC 6802]|uniref:lipase family protein n=1 Tax=Pseudanabaena sp. PCC 6802 TaxID=118173 RepID=UPI00034518D7|nr:lipase family protein [Pseudanabaena sp. PCC 6802]